MIKFPVILKPHKRFEHSDHLFVADIEAGCVFEAGQIIFDILDICERNTTIQIKNSLRLKYERSEIDDAFMHLFQLKMAGILFQQRADAIPENGEFSGRIVIMPGFFISIHQKPFLTRLTYHRLLKSLCSEFEVFMSLVEPEEDSKQDWEFGWEGLNTFKVPNNVGVNMSKYYPSGCHGLFSMPDSSFYDINLAYSADIPTIFYVSSNEYDRQSILDKYFLLRHIDLLCVDSWWMKDWLSSIVPSVEEVMVIPTGVEEDLYNRRNHESAKSTTASAFQKERIKSDPIVLLFLPNASYENREVVNILAHKNPQIIFIIVDGIDSLQVDSKLENVEFFKVEDIDDYQALPVILSAADVGYFHAEIGACMFYLSSALSCGVPMIISGHSDSESMKDFGLHIQIEPDNTPSEIAEMLSKNISSLLENQTMLDRYRDKSLIIGKELSWASVSRFIKSSFVDLRERLSEKNKDTEVIPGFFQYYYDTTTGKTKPMVYERQSFTSGNLNKLIAQELLIDHNENQVRIVLKHICGDKETADKILRKLKG